MTKYPKVTVITPVLNGIDTIEGCISSVVSQNYPNIEHIIVDGISTDGTLNVLKRLGVTYYSEKDAGIYDAFNKGISISTGEYISILNADDKYRTETVVANMIKFMIQSNLDIGHGKVDQVDHAGRTARMIGYDVSRKRLLRKCKVAHPSVFVRRNVYEEYGTYSIGFKIAADYEFFLRVWDKVNIGFYPEIITTMRLGGVSNSQVRRSYRESMAAALLHGAGPVSSLMNYQWEMFKARLLQLKFRQKGRS